MVEAQHKAGWQGWSAGVDWEIWPGSPRLQSAALPLNSAAVPLFGRFIPLIGRKIPLFLRVAEFAPKPGQINGL